MSICSNCKNSISNGGKCKEYQLSDGHYTWLTPIFEGDDELETNAIYNDGHRTDDVKECISYKGEHNMKVYNGTAHDVHIFDPESAIVDSDGRKLILKEGSVPAYSFSKQKALNCKKENKNIDTKLSFLKGAVIFTSIDPLPEGYNLYIVSSLYRAAMKELGHTTDQIALVGDVVYNSEGKPVGCLHLSVG